jgi:fructose-bisphosphate aldolase class I
MSKHDLNAVARALVATGKGILAADESAPTIKKRFDSIGVASTEENRRDYREMLFSAPGAEKFISGVILYDETLRQKAKSGKPLVELLTSKGVIPGIKVDSGAKTLPGSPKEKVTEGLDGLSERLAEYAGLGARFAKWRAVIAITDTLPSRTCLEVNAHALARYAKLCQEAGIVPIVEPEVLMDGTHTIERSEAVTREALHATFVELHRQGVELEGMLLKPNMVLSGYECPQQAGVQQVADATLRTFRRHVPAAVPGIVFLSGGQSDELATAHLDAMNRMDASLRPWKLSFSYGRALQAPALKAWGGKATGVAAGQAAYMHRARCNGAAAKGAYTSKMEAEGKGSVKLVSQD